MSFSSKTVRDRVILTLKNVKFLKFRPPSSILLEIPNVGYLKNL